MTKALSKLIDTKIDKKNIDKNSIKKLIKKKETIPTIKKTYSTISH